MPKKEIKTGFAPRAIGPYSQAVSCNGFVFLSGQIPLDPVSGEIVGITIEEQTGQVFKNIEGILIEAGLCLDHVVKTTVYLKDIADFSRMNVVYAGRFKPPYPSRATVEVSRLPKDVLIEVDVIAAEDVGR
ncbi:MAG: RidA family protein [Deltaproteobacteria bacterium]|nr:RidA family protein [Deltaproteobacteria bacterium]